MDLSGIIAGLTAMASVLTGTAADQFIKVLLALINALPAIEKGWASEKPFLALLWRVMSNGNQPIEAATFDDQLALLHGQVAQVAGQVAADEAEQP